MEEKVSIYVYQVGDHLKKRRGRPAVTRVAKPVSSCRAREGVKPCT